MVVRAYLLPITLIALVGCSFRDASPARVRVEVPAMNVAFSFPEPLTVRSSTEESLLSGPTTHMQAQTQPYRTERPRQDAQGVPQWTLPRAVAQAIHDQRSCEPVKSSSVVLPVDTTTAVACDLVLDAAGRSIVWMVGIGRPYQDVPFLQSSFLVLDEDRYHVFSYVFRFPEADATVTWLQSTFTDRHPRMSSLVWPNTSFKLLTTEVRQALEQQVHPLSPEVEDILHALREVAFSVAPLHPSVPGG